MPLSGPKYMKTRRYPMKFALVLFLRYYIATKMLLVYNNVWIHNLFDSPKLRGREVNSEGADPIRVPDPIKVKGETGATTQRRAL